MKRHWLRGVLLGVSLALLLAGGVAVAQGLYAMPDQDCFECQYRADGWPPPEDRILELTIGGYDTMDLLCGRLTMAGMLWDEGCGPVMGDPPCVFGVAVECATMQVFYETNCWADANGAALGGDVGPAAYPDAVYGEWVWKQWQEELDDGDGMVTAGPVYAKFRFAEDCTPVEEEFVPEPGSILLLGSGLAGLAGYATLRWRTRE